MTRVVALFNLKHDVDPAVYEEWARTTDLPTVNALGSIQQFSAHRTAGLLTGEPQAPFQYVEVIDIKDMTAFGADLATPVMQKIAAEFQAFADNPLFMLTEDL